MLPINPGLVGHERQLLQLYRQLASVDRQNLLAYAEFLLQRGSAGVEATADSGVALEPLGIPRPESESVVAAMRRLTATYPMLETRSLLDEAATLMSAHLLQGRSAIAVIDELEALFARSFSALQSRED